MQTINSYCVFSKHRNVSLQLIIKKLLCETNDCVTSEASKYNKHSSTVSQCVCLKKSARKKIIFVLPILHELSFYHIFRMHFFKISNVFFFFISMF